MFGATSAEHQRMCEFNTEGSYLNLCKESSRRRGDQRFCCILARQRLNPGLPTCWTVLVQTEILFLKQSGNADLGGSFELDSLQWFGYNWY